MIVVAAPTSRIGSQLLGHLLGRAQLRVVARDPSRLSKEIRAQADVVIGSHGDPKIISAALDGADTVFWLVPPDPKADDIVDYDRRFTTPCGHTVSATPSLNTASGASCTSPLSAAAMTAWPGTCPRRWRWTS